MKKIVLYTLLIAVAATARALDYEVTMKAESNGRPYLVCQGKVRIDSICADTLIPVNYFIALKAEGPEGANIGDIAYVEGTYYDFLDHVWHEYQLTDESGTDGFIEKVLGGYFSLFAPQSVRGAENMSDSVNTVCFDSNKMSLTTYLPGTDIIVTKATLTFNTDSLAVKNEVISAPGTDYETLVTTEFSYPDSVFPSSLKLTKESVMNYWADDYAMYGPTTVERLPGRCIPFFTANRGKGSIYHFYPDHHTGKPQVWVAIEKPDDGLRPVLQTIIDAIPENVELTVFFESNRLDLINEFVSDMNITNVLNSAHKLFEPLGITESPTIIFRNTDGRVADVIIGQNNDLGSVVNKIANILK